MQDNYSQLKRLQKSAFLSDRHYCATVRYQTCTREKGIESSTSWREKKILKLGRLVVDVPDKLIHAGGDDDRM